MSRVHANLEEKDFTMPSSVEKKSVCSITGYLARPSCPTVTEYFAKGSVPDETCPGHGNYYEESDSSDEESTDNSENNSGSTGNTDNSGNTGGNSGGNTGGNTGGNSGGNSGGNTGETGGGETPTPEQPSARLLLPILRGIYKFKS